jgi:hypothetical protein
MIPLTVMLRVPLTLRALMLVPLLALGVDHARAALACGPGAESCLEASGHGWLGVTGVGLLLVYAAILAVGMARVVAGRAPGFLRMWGIGTAGVAAVCAGQALLAAALGDGAALGGGWLELAAFCTVAGAALAFTLRVAPAAAALVRSLRPAAPRPPLSPAPARTLLALPAVPPRLRLALAAPGRGPPLG